MRLGDVHSEVLHHAYVIEGGVDALDDVLGELESAFGVTALRSYADAYIRSFDALSVADAREVVGFATRAPLHQGGRKIIVLAFNSAGTEAQNALLKTLEEPVARTHIFLLTPTADALLQTVRSRCVVLAGASDGEQEQSELVRDFINASEAQRIKTVATLLKKDKNGTVDKARLLALLSGIERYLAETAVIDASRRARQLRAVLGAKRALYNKGAMLKMHMETVALVL